MRSTFDTLHVVGDQKNGAPPTTPPNPRGPKHLSKQNNPMLGWIRREYGIAVREVHLDDTHWRDFP